MALPVYSQQAHLGLMPAKPESLPDDTQHVHTTEIAVRWGDMDAGGHVNNSRFFTYFEEARVDWLGQRSTGRSLPTRGRCSYGWPRRRAGRCRCSI